MTVHDIARVGELLDGVRGFVGPELTLGGISFSYEDPEAVLAQARTAAIDNARVRAGQYAEAADAEVGEIVRIVESSVPTPVFARDFARGRSRRRRRLDPGAARHAGTGRRRVAWSSK